MGSLEMDRLVFKINISKLKNKDLARYKEHLLDNLLGQASLENKRIAILDRIDATNKEINIRNINE